MATVTKKRKRRKKNAKRSSHVWGAGLVHDGFTVYGMMCAGLLPKSRKTLEKAFQSGHPVSENGSPKMRRPSTLSHDLTEYVAANPYKNKKYLVLLGLWEHLTGE